MEILNICMQPGFLRVIYIIKIILNIMRFVIPIGLIVKLVMDLVKNLVNPEEKKALSHVKSRVIATIIVFLVPTFIALIMKFVEYSVGVNSYNGVTECWDFANMDYIKELEAVKEMEELEVYLTDIEKKLAEADKYKLALQKKVESNKMKNEVGEYANNTNNIKCGTGSTYNQGLFNAVRSAGYKTREGVVAAALYLSSHINVHIPYFWSGGHFHSYNGYYDGGDDFMGISDKWGCSVKMAFGGTDMQKDGQKYPFGMDCSGFVVWAIYNGGYYTGDKKQELRFTTGSQISSMGGVKIDSVSLKNSKGKVKPGDVLYVKGHVGMVIEVQDDKLIVAEERGYKYGLVVNEIKYSSSRFSHVYLMDNFYKNYKKDSKMWSGFK